VRFGVLICYEDLVSDLARSISVSGANVLVNLTNDAWYGDTSAPYQHHLLARWRAIETGRYLLRATNTGLTAVVDWNGMTVASLPIFTENVLLYSIPLSEKITTYMLWGDLPFKILLMFLLLLDFVPRIRRKLKR